MSWGCINVLLGAVLGFCASWFFNHSVGWAIFHGILGWLYVLYKIVWTIITGFGS